MNAGLPGTGIGGLFYIASALWMPVHRALAGVGVARGWRRIAAQIGIAGGILVALGATAAALDLLITARASSAATADGAAAARVFRWVALAGTAGVLLFVVLAVEVARLLPRRAHALPVAATTAAVALKPHAGTDAVADQLALVDVA